MGNMNSNDVDMFGDDDSFIVDPEGFAKIIRYLAAQTFTSINDRRLRFNELVTDVHYALADDPIAALSNSQKGVYVKTASGNEYYARFCIITFSVSSIFRKSWSYHIILTNIYNFVQNAVLLSGNVNFQPPLPHWKVRALNQSETVVYDKIFVKFADDIRPFWDATEWILFVDSEPVTPQAADCSLIRCQAVRTALKYGDSYTLGYFTVCCFM